MRSKKQKLLEVYRKNPTYENYTAYKECQNTAFEEIEYTTESLDEIDYEINVDKGFRDWKSYEINKEEHSSKLLTDGVVTTNEHSQKIGEKNE